MVLVQMPLLVQRCPCHQDIADHPLVDKLFCPLVLGPEPPVATYHQLDAVTVAGVDDIPGFSVRHRQGFLDDHVRAGFGRGDRLVAMDVVRRGDDHGVEVGLLGKHLVIIGVPGGRSPLLGGTLGCFGVNVAARHEDSARRPLDRREVRDLGDAPAPYDGEPHCLLHLVPS